MDLRRAIIFEPTEHCSDGNIVIILEEQVRMFENVDDTHANFFEARVYEVLNSKHSHIDILNVSPYVCISDNFI